MFINKIVSYGNNYVILSIIQKDRAGAVSVICDLFIIVTICSSVYFRGYENPPTPSVQRLHEAGRQFYQGVISGLKSKSTTPVYVSMDLDIWRYVSRGRGELSYHKGFMLYTIQEMSRLPLPDKWWYWLNTHGEGYAIDPPIKLKSILSWTPKKHVAENGKLSQAPQLPIERLCLDMLKRPCNIENL